MQFTIAKGLSGTGRQEMTAATRLQPVFVAWARRWALAIVILALQALPVGWISQATAASPQTFVAETEAGLDSVRARGGLAGRRAGCKSLVAKVFSLQALARRVAGKRWRTLDKASAEALVAATTFRLAEECAAQLGKAKAGKAVVRRTRKTSKALNVTVLYPDPDGNSRVLVWSLIPGGTFGYRAIDLSIDGRSVALTLRDDFNAALSARDGSIKDAIAAVRRRARR